MKEASMSDPPRYPEAAQDHFYDDDDWDDDDPGEDWDDCGLMPDGQCLKAGSEQCDWECPMRESDLFVGSRAWRRKHGYKERS